MEKSFGTNKIQSGLLGLEQLHNLACWEDVRAEFELNVPALHGLYHESIKTKSISWFVRWTTDKLLKFRATSEVHEAKSTHFILKVMKDVIPEFQRATLAEQAYILDKGLLQAEVVRFRELSGLLQQCFDSTHASLSSREESWQGVKELVVVASEVDIAGGIKDEEVRSHVFSLRDRAIANSESFRVVSSAILKQLNDWHYPLRLEIALNTMLEVLPKLEESLFWKMTFLDSWGPILVSHGMGSSATKLAASVHERRTAVILPSALNTPSSVLPQDSDFLYQTGDRAPRPRSATPAITEDDMDESSDGDEIELGMRTPQEGDYEWVEDPRNNNLQPFNFSTPAPHATYTQVFKPRMQVPNENGGPRVEIQRLGEGTRFVTPYNILRANTRNGFAVHLQGGSSVDTPSTVAEGRTPALPTPSLPGPRLPVPVATAPKGRRARKAKTEGKK